MPALRSITSNELKRSVDATQGRVREVECRFPGSRLYAPTSLGTHGAVLLLHGSEGGAAGYTALSAIRLASAGYVALAFAYFGVPGTPSKLERAPLERTIAAARWLKESRLVAGLPVALSGASRGAEHAILIASILRDTSSISAVAAHAPISVVCGSWDPATRAHAASPLRAPGGGAHLEAWTYQGRPIRDETPIALERYEGPVFLSHGRRDMVWPSSHTEELEARLRAAKRDVEVHYLEGEGHVPSRDGWAGLEAMRLAFLRRTVGRYES
jgi:dipeptidyl aminopeptidase/acylaminoacyl peptidase